VDVVSAALGSGPQAMGGVRMTGAGFGGCLVAITRAPAVDTVMTAIEKTYNPGAAVPASADVYTMAGGAREITPR
jgi:galactokinase